MKQLDLTPNLHRRKYSRVCYQTVYINHPYYGFADSDTGISFVRATKKGIRTSKTGEARWYFGSSGTIQKAVAKIRRRYNLKTKVNGWKKVRIKVWNFSGVDEIVEQLKTKIYENN